MKWKSIVQTEAVCLFITVAVAAGLTYSNPSNWAGFLISSFIFSHCIGISISVLVRVFHRRSQSLPVPGRFGLLFLLFLTGGFVGTFVGRWLVGMIFGVNLGILGHVELLLINLVLAILFGSGAVVYFSLRATAQNMAKTLKEKEINEERLERLKTKAELEALQAKVNPHFLFNTLNSIASLISENPAAAESTVEKLSGLFRYTLQRSASSTVKLGEELDIVRSYLDIEKIRFGERLQFSIKLDDRLKDIEIPPLLLQTLVENSVKHGVAPEVRGGMIVIEAAHTGEKCVLSVRDSGKGFSGPVGESGFGLKSIRDRLKLAYGDRATLEISRDTMTQIKITLPLA